MKYIISKWLSDSRTLDESEIVMGCHSLEDADREVRRLGSDHFITDCDGNTIQSYKLRGEG